MNPSNKSIVAVAIAFAAVSSAASAHARDRPAARLVYVLEAGAEGCPPESRFAERVSERLGYAPFAPAEPRTLLVMITAQNARWTARVTVTDAAGSVTGQRDVVSTASCEEVVTTAAVVVSLLLEPGGPAVQETPTETAKALPPPREEPGQAPEAVAPPVAPPRAETPVGIAAGVEPVIGIGSAPATSVGAAVFAALRRKALLVSLEARADLPASDDEARGPSARTWLAQGSLIPCYSVTLLAVCGVISGGSFWAEGIGGLGASRIAGAFYFALGARVESTVPLGDRVFLRAHVDLVAPVTRASLEIGSTRVYETRVLAGAAGLGFGVRFR